MNTGGSMIFFALTGFFWALVRIKITMNPIRIAAMDEAITITIIILYLLLSSS
ncbi:hypothetical protein [Rossellomorea marisflavi]|uniref:hypothetical protein n=2 Tax=Bacillaceae TaxID=186817 RepID=UPI001E5B86FF|nr:hypothetical protein [Rossellomorea marisflavi]MCM2604482.1 hypothetical protein [Rossellomorea marisflavi]